MSIITCGDHGTESALALARKADLEYTMDVAIEAMRYCELGEPLPAHLAGTFAAGKTWSDLAAEYRAARRAWSNLVDTFIDYQM